jgi:hypothetical protein
MLRAVLRWKVVEGKALAFAGRSLSYSTRDSEAREPTGEECCGSGCPHCPFNLSLYVPDFEAIERAKAVPQIAPARIVSPFAAATSIVQQETAIQEEEKRSDIADKGKSPPGAESDFPVVKPGEAGQTRGRSS